MAKGAKKAKATPIPVPPAVEPILLPASERGLSPEAIDRFDRARRALLSPTGSKEAKDGHARTIASIETAPKIEADRAWREEARNETASLAQARGETVTTDGDRLVITSRDDGLKALYLANLISELGYDTGKRCRDCYEARVCDVGSQLGNEGGGSGHNNHAFVAARYERAQMTAAIAQIERKVAARKPASLQMLRWVIEQGHNVRAFGGGRAYYRNVEALGEALDVAAVVFKEIDEKRREARKTA